MSRSRNRSPAAESAAPPTAEVQLVKAAASEALPPTAAANGAAPRPEPPAAAALRPAPPPVERPQEGGFFARNGAALPPRPPAPVQPSQPLNGEHRRTLHLSLGGNGADFNAPERPAERISERPAEPPPRQGFGSGGEGSPAYGNGQREPRYGFPPAPAARPAEPDRRKDGGAFIDRELRTRVDGDIAAFLVAFDAALEGDTQESRSALREATDRLLRAGARTRIELERLEARVPLGQRENRAEPAWRQR